MDSWYRIEDDPLFQYHYRNREGCYMIEDYFEEMKYRMIEKTLWFNSGMNYFEDWEHHDAPFVVDIFRYITPNDLWLFKESKKDAIVKSLLSDWGFVELVYVDEENEDDEIECFDSESGFCSGGRCRFSSELLSAREEICRSCRGGEF